jgi:hypothetical protein
LFLFVAEKVEKCCLKITLPFRKKTKTPVGGGASVRLLAVPSFAETGALALLNLRTLQVQLMRFGGSGGGAGGGAS